MSAARVQMEFTFQYGEIKSLVLVFIIHFQMIFTFQYGEIKSSFCTSKGRAIIQFTFQYGEIKSGVAWWKPVACFAIYIPVWRD